jgi:hypothetical protein
MGRRKNGCHSIRQIRIIIDDHVEVFDLELETLLDRRSSVRRARALYDYAISHIQRSNSNHGPEDTQTIFQEPLQIGLAPNRAQPEVNLDRSLPPASTATESDIWSAEWDRDSPYGFKDDVSGFGWPFKS